MDETANFLSFSFLLRSCIKTFIIVRQSSRIMAQFLLNVVLRFADGNCTLLSYLSKRVLSYLKKVKLLIRLIVILVLHLKTFEHFPKCFFRCLNLLVFWEVWEYKFQILKMNRSWQLVDIFGWRSQGNFHRKFTLNNSPITLSIT